MKSSHIHETTLDFGCLGEQDVEVKYNYYPGRAARMYMPNGDPGYPEDPAEVEILSVTTNLGTLTEIEILDFLTLVDLESLQTEIEENHLEDQE
jgi:hypothetical protein